MLQRGRRFRENNGHIHQGALSIVMIDAISIAAPQECQCRISSTGPIRYSHAVKTVHAAQYKTEDRIRKIVFNVIRIDG
jgi:hypothetical protein